MKVASNPPATHQRPASYPSATERQPSSHPSIHHKRSPKRHRCFRRFGAKRVIFSPHLTRKRKKSYPELDQNMICSSRFATHVPKLESGATKSIITLRATDPILSWTKARNRFSILPKQDQCAKTLSALGVCNALEHNHSWANQHFLWHQQ